MSKRLVIITLLLPVSHPCDQHHFFRTVPAVLQGWHRNTGRLEVSQ